MKTAESPQLINAIRTLQAALEEHDAAISAAKGIGRSDWACLKLLVQNGAQSPGAIQRALGLTSGSVTALLDRLEKRDLIIRCADPSDRRALRIEPLAKAVHLVTQAAMPLDQLATRLEARWGGERCHAAGQACLDLAKLVDWASRKADDQALV
ncbi:MAG: MarR family transcriptional regulator [Pseudomonadota bacterium]